MTTTFEQSTPLASPLLEDLELLCPVIQPQPLKAFLPGTIPPGLTAIGGPYLSGKTTVAQQIGAMLAESGMPVLYAAWHEGRDQMLDRHIEHVHVPSISPTNEAVLIHMIERVEAEEETVPAVIVDPLILLRQIGPDRMDEELGNIVRLFAQIAADYSTPVITTVPFLCGRYRNPDDSLALGGIELMESMLRQFEEYPGLIEHASLLLGLHRMQEYEMDVTQLWCVKCLGNGLDSPMRLRLNTDRMFFEEAEI